MPGGGTDNACFDARIVGGQLELRVERASPGNGRVYQIMFRASDDAGLSSDGVVTYCVPMSGAEACVDDGQYFNSLNCATSTVPSAPATLSLSVIRTVGHEVTLRYSLPRDGLVALEVFDAAGRKVGILARGLRVAGEYELRWQMQGAGVWFARLSLDRDQFTKKLVLPQ